MNLCAFERGYHALAFVITYSDATWVILARAREGIFFIHSQIFALTRGE